MAGVGDAGSDVAMTCGSRLWRHLGSLVTCGRQNTRRSPSCRAAACRAAPFLAAVYFGCSLLFGRRSQGASKLFDRKQLINDGCRTLTGQGRNSARRVTRGLCVGMGSHG